MECELLMGVKEQDQEGKGSAKEKEKRISQSEKTGYVQCCEGHREEGMSNTERLRKMKKSKRL